MADYIDRDAVMQAFSDYVWNSNHSDLVPTPRWNDAVEVVRCIQSADVKPSVRGEWIENKYRWTCSNCRKMFSFYDNAFLHRYANYCPNCGAKMYEEDKS